jgi:UDP-3-O-[3-hydroxymyristoyl] glucosamine N-acyltransferase
MPVTAATLREAIGLESVTDFECDDIGLVDDHSYARLLTFLDDERFLDNIVANTSIVAVLVGPALAGAVQSVGRVVVESGDPRHDFYSLHNWIALRQMSETPTTIDPTAVIHPGTYISPHDVIIGQRCVLEPNVTVLPGVQIGESCVIHSGAVLGVEGFEHKRTTRGVLSVIHDGLVVLGDNVVVGAATCVARGFRWRSTLIGDECKLDNLIHVGHGAQLGRRCFIAASAMLAGSTIGDDAWVGPNATISNGLTIGSGAYVTLGAVVTKDVGPNERVSGNFAVPHEHLLEHVRRLARGE